MIAHSNWPVEFLFLFTCGVPLSHFRSARGRQSRWQKWSRWCCCSSAAKEAVSCPGGANKEAIESHLGGAVKWALKDERKTELIQIKPPLPSIKNKDENKLRRQLLPDVYLESPPPLQSLITNKAKEAALLPVDVCCQHYLPPNIPNGEPNVVVFNLCHFFKIRTTHNDKD